MHVGVCASWTADFEMMEELGRGAHGVVHKARSRKDNKVYVIKAVSVKRMKEKQRRNAVAEVHHTRQFFCLLAHCPLLQVLILRRVSHPNVVRYYNCFVANQTLYIVMEFASKGDLHALIEVRCYCAAVHWPWSNGCVTDPKHHSSASKTCQALLW